MPGVGQGGRGAGGQRGRGAEGQGGRGAEGQRGRGAEGQRGRIQVRRELRCCSRQPTVIVWVGLER